MFRLDFKLLSVYYHLISSQFIGKYNNVKMRQLHLVKICVFLHNFLAIQITSRLSPLQYLPYMSLAFLGWGGVVGGWKS